MNEAERIDLLMQPIEYVSTDGGSRIWACGVCRCIKATKNDAIRCYTCAPQECQAEGCDTRVPPRSYPVLCGFHRIEANNDRERRTFANATKILAEDYDLSDPCFDQDGEYYSSVNDFIDQADLDNNRIHHRFVYGVTPRKLHLDPGQVFECLDDGETPGEIFDVKIPGEKELTEAIKTFNETQDVSYYVEDNSVVIVLPWPDPAEFGLEPSEVHKDWPAKWDHRAVARGIEDCLS